MEAFDGSVLVPGCDHDGSLSDIEISDGMVLLSSKDIAVLAVARSGLNVVANHGAGGGSVFLNEGVERGGVVALEQANLAASGAPAVSEVLSVSRKSKRTACVLNELGTFRAFQDRRFTRCRRPVGKQTPWKNGTAGMRGAEHPPLTQLVAYGRSKCLANFRSLRGRMPMFRSGPLFEKSEM